MADVFQEKQVATLQAEIDFLRQRITELEETVVSLTNERKNIEEAYRLLVDHSFQALVIYQNNQIVFANPTTSHITGYTLDELYAMTEDDVLALIHPEDRERIAGYVRARREQDTFLSQYSFQIFRKDGEVRWLEELVTLTEYRGVPATQSAYIDITERKRAEETLRWSFSRQEVYQRMLEQIETAHRNLESKNRELYESQSFLHAIIEYSPAVIFVKDLQGKTLLINQRGAELHRREREDIIGRSDTELFSPELARSYRADDQRIIATGQSLEVEEVFSDDLPCQTFLSIKFPLYDEQQKIHSIGVIATNITERKQTEEAYRTLVEHSLQGFAIVQDYRYVFINKMVTDINGYTAEELMAMSFEDIVEQIYPDDRAIFVENMRNRIEGRSTPSRYEIRILRKDGEVRCIEVYAARTLYRGRPAIQVATVDITERKEVEMALRESEARYRSIFENATIGIFQSTVEGQLIAINPAYARMLGYETVAEAMAMIRDVAEHLYVEPSRRAEIVQMVLQQQETTRFENRYRRKDGSMLIAMLNVWGVRDAQDQVRYLEGFIEDITERKQAERAREAAYERMKEMNRHLQHSRDVLQTIINGIQDGLVLLNRGGVVVMTNTPMATFFASTPEEMTGRSWEALSTMRDPPFPGNLPLYTLRDGQPRRRRERLTLADGQVRILDMQTFPLAGLEQMTDQVILHIVDITETLQLETLMIENERFEASGRLAATVAHEINSPLQTIRNFLYLAEDASDPQHTSYLKLVREEIDRVGTIVRQLLHLFRPDATDTAPVDINALIERIALLMSGTLAKHTISLVSQLEPDLPLIQGRAHQLTQVLLNLITNAIDVMSAGGGTVTIQTRTASQDHAHIALAGQLNDAGEPQTLAALMPALLIEISDTGPGMTSDIQERIFESFFTTKPQGTGLGLAISQKIVQQHHGAIIAESIETKGSKFTIVLPLVEQ
jgi:PAS domain S-box-containing protein